MLQNGCKPYCLPDVTFRKPRAGHGHGRCLPGPLQTVVATTGGAVTAAYCGWSGSVAKNVSRCQLCNYSRNKDLCEMAMKNFKTGPFDHSGTSPRRLWRRLYGFPSVAVHCIRAAPGLRRRVCRGRELRRHRRQPERRDRRLRDLRLRQLQFHRGRQQPGDLRHRLVHVRVHKSESG